MADIRSSGVTKSPVSSQGPAASSESYSSTALPPMSIAHHQYMTPGMAPVAV
ncbi:hypothetical protein Dsin_020447 [Dipteronia sinensis]|uniref:Uncharacterized protein n=1 Tax=Dipteronia sinensis TaxID=43782 RepID=A0AAE0AAK7_9ROSI|nr:hypothetical protein Dsin_020447 [Dipteronia sinensis]